MKLSVLVLAALVAAPGIVSCGGGGSGVDGIDLSGFYEVTSYSRNEDGCEVGPAYDRRPYIQLSQRNFLGSPSYLLDHCEAVDDDTCATGVPPYYFTRPIDMGWEGSSSTESGACGGGSCSCTYIYEVYSAVLDDPDHVTVEIRAYRESEQISASDCPEDEAKKRGTSMPCAEYDRIQGRRVAN